MCGVAAWLEMGRALGLQDASISKCCLVVYKSFGHLLYPFCPQVVL